MKRAKTFPHRDRNGSALVLSMIFVAIFSALAAAMATISATNVQIAENLRKADTTRSCAESGLEVMRYWIGKVEMSGTIADNERFGQLYTKLQSELPATIVRGYNDPNITISNVSLLLSSGQSFSAVLTKIDNVNVRLDVTGHYGSLTRTIRSNCDFRKRADNVFDFGVATKGPLVLSGSVEIEGVHINVESNAYIESPNTLLALSISGNSHIAGNVKIVNPSADVFLGPQAGVGGETGSEAMKNITKGVPPSAFPDMSPGIFESYATNVLSPSTNLKNVTLTNIRIPAGMNPKFTGTATLRGVVFVESPNVVEFAGNVDMTGVIVTNGSQSDDSGTNKLIFQGNVASRSVAELPQEAQFAGLHSQTGTFIMAPGFAASFGGNFSAQTGAIAANGVQFFGNAGGTIRGSVINYASTNMTLNGNSELLFNRSGLVEVPAGFKPQIVLRYDRSSYAEVVL